MQVQRRKSQTSKQAPSGSDGSIKVSCRVRPHRLSSLPTIGSLASSVVSVDGDSVLVSQGYAQESLEPFTFDHVFGQDSTQEDIYTEVVDPIVEGVLSGINGTVFCYGQTGSGKTYTMEGTEQDLGLLPRLGKSIFDGTGKPPEQVSVCFVEIYMERLQDLLDPTNKVEVRETMSGSVYLANASERLVTSSAELLSCVKAGQKNRSVASTKMNERSSRSHSVFSVSVKTCDEAGLPLQGVLHFVDLAGSESQGRTGAKGEILEQSRHINQSLLGLGRVIAALGTGQPHVPYRDSKLTRILQDSLGGTAKTSLIINISPESINAYETINSLRFGQGASLVKNAPKVNLVNLTVDDLRKLLGERDSEIAVLRARIVGLESSPTPQKRPQYASISTPDKRRLKWWEEEDQLDCSSTLSAWKDQLKRNRWTLFRCSFVALLVAGRAYVTNPGAHEGMDGFRQHVQSRHMFALLHCILETLGLASLQVWNLGLASLAQENSRFFIGAFSHWVELPSLAWKELSAVDALAFAIIVVFLVGLLFPAKLAGHCTASLPNLRAGFLWSVLLAQVAHIRIFDMVLNVMLLYSVAPAILQSFGDQRLLLLFFAGGAIAILSFLIVGHVFCRRQACTYSGASASLFALMGFSHAAAITSPHVRWLGCDWSWSLFAVLQTLLHAASLRELLVHLCAAAVGWAVADRQLLEAVPAGLFDLTGLR